MRVPKVLRSELKYSSYMFNVENEELQLPSGELIFRDRVVHKGAAIIIPQLANSNLVMVRQYRNAIRGELIEFPAGTLELNEPPLECAQRELAEEAGQRAAEWHSLGTLYPAPGFCSEIQHLFLARSLTSVSQQLDEDEIIDILELAPKEVEGLIKEGKINDGKTIASFFKARVAGYI